MNALTHTKGRRLLNSKMFPEKIKHFARAVADAGGTMSCTAVSFEATKVPFRTFRTSFVPDQVSSCIIPHIHTAKTDLAENPSRNFMHYICLEYRE